MVEVLCTDHELGSLEGHLLGCTLCRKTYCPACARFYTPVLIKRSWPEVVIQIEFPQATSDEREQLVSGLCSDRCWNDYLNGSLGG